MTFQDVETARETYHQKTKKGWLIIAGITGVLLIVAIIFLLPKLLKNPGFWALETIMPSFVLVFFILVVGAIAISFATRKEAAAYRKAYKAYFVEQNLKNTFTDLRYSHENGLEENILDATGMINTGDRYSSNDLTIAKYKDVQFTQADAHIEVEHTDSDGNTTYITIFKGRFMIFEFPKKFNFKLELIGHFGAASIPGKNQSTGRKMAKISTESTDFNHLFKIYAEDGFEAFYILDPAFMAKIEDISNRYKNRVLFGFINNQLLIGLSDGKDSFEPPKASKPIDEQAEMAKIRADIKVITDFVDSLSLDRKIFK